MRNILIIAGIALLTACQPRVVTKTRTVEVPVPQPVSVPDEFTAPLSLPPYPEGRLTNGDLATRIQQCEAVVRQCNADRAQVRDLSAQEGGDEDETDPADPG